MTDKEFRTLERITTWHVEGERNRNGRIGYSAVYEALVLLKKHRRGSRPVSGSILPLLQEPELVYRNDWIQELQRRYAEQHRSRGGEG